MRHPRQHVGLREENAKKQKEVAKAWRKLPASCCSGKAHCYQDVKSFVLPLTPAQRKTYKQTKCTGHLQKRSEGTQAGFAKPRTSHSWLGMPSVDVAASVAINRSRLSQPARMWTTWPRLHMHDANNPSRLGQSAPAV